MTKMEKVLTTLTAMCAIGMIVTLGALISHLGWATVFSFNGMRGLAYVDSFVRGWTLFGMIVTVFALITLGILIGAYESYKSQEEA